MEFRRQLSPVAYPSVHGTWVSSDRGTLPGHLEAQDQAAIPYGVAAEGRTAGASYVADRAMLMSARHTVEQGPAERRLSGPRHLARSCSSGLGRAAALHPSGSRWHHRGWRRAM